ncbi:MAG: glycoside hydrolase family 97 protein [Acidobacteria bacterium]|nr:glycoside hydrolase family 97 protein [Acidobacteriota bacterium]
MKNLPSWTTLFAASLPLVWGQSSSPLELRSPDGTIRLLLQSPARGDKEPSPHFSLFFRDRQILKSCDLGLTLQGAGRLLERTEIKGIKTRNVDETYSVPWGKSNPIVNRCREMQVSLGREDGKLSQLLFRAYDDGVAFRYAIPAQPGLDQFVITDERSLFRVAGNPRTWGMYRQRYDTPHEGLYDERALSSVKQDTLLDVPFTFQFEDGLTVAIAEASLRGYAKMYLLKSPGSGSDGLVSQLSPWPGQNIVKIKGRAPLSSPWRVVMIGQAVGRLLESNILLNLNEPCRIQDTSWIRPGKSTWHWWNGTAGEPAGFQTGLDYRTMRHYIDFCARNGIDYHAVVATPDDYPWYTQKTKGFAPDGSSDPCVPRPELEWPKLLDYAARKEVGMRAWVHCKALEGRIDEVFATYARWGLRGLMVDFLDRDDQQMVEFAELVVQKAALHRLHIQLHGVWQPTGLSRTYPNLLNHEGVLNLEYLKWSADCTPDHNLIVPFTRMLAGPMDYHLGGFRSVLRAAFQPRIAAPTVMGTRSHHLAMYVVYENPMPMVCDYPSAYEGQPGFDLIRTVPTTWDETRVLQADPGQYLVVARRRGSRWYVGGMTNWTPRRFTIPLGFLRQGLYSARSWSDAPETASDPNRLRTDHQSVDHRASLRFDTSPGGGFVLEIEPR